MSKPTSTRTEPVPDAELPDRSPDSCEIECSPTVPPPLIDEISAERLETFILVSLLSNPRVEQLARLTSADPAVQGAELHAYTRRLVAGYRAAQQEARP